MINKEKLKFSKKEFDAWKILAKAVKRNNIDLTLYSDGKWSGNYKTT